MSNAVYPTLPGLAFDVVKEPEFRTSIKAAVTGKETRIGYMLYPIYNMKLQYEFLRSSATYAELQSLLGFFLQRRGALDTFLLTDPDDYTVTDQAFGSGDGATSAFQLARTYGGFTEPVWWPNAITNVKVNGVNASYVHSGNGVVTISPTPANGLPLTWTGTYYFRCRFRKDAMSFTKFMYQLWHARTVEMRGCLGDKIL